MNGLRRRECHFVMLGCGSLDSGNCLKSLLMVTTTGHAWDSRHSGNAGPGTVTRPSRMCGQLAHGSQELPAIHESCRELTRTRRMCRAMKNLWTKVLRSPANGAAANMQIAEDTSGWEHFSAQFWFAWIQYVMLCVGLSAISWPGPGPVTKHKNQYRGLWTPGPWLLTPTSSHRHHTSLTLAS